MWILSISLPVASRLVGQCAIANLSAHAVSVHMLSLLVHAERLQPCIQCHLNNKQCKKRLGGLGQICWLTPIPDVAVPALFEFKRDRLATISMGVVSHFDCC